MIVKRVFRTSQWRQLQLQKAASHLTRFVVERDVQAVCGRIFRLSGALEQRVAAD